MEDQKINTVELIRKIRDQHYHQLIGKSNKERIDFYQLQSQKIIDIVPALLQDHEFIVSPESVKKLNNNFT
jgi:hypothetical protein